jgi:hypothetical protein
MSQDVSVGVTGPIDVLLGDDSPEMLLSVGDLGATTE